MQENNDYQQSVVDFSIPSQLHVFVLQDELFKTIQERDAERLNNIDLQNQMQALQEEMEFLKNVSTPNSIPGSLCCELMASIVTTLNNVMHCKVREKTTPRQFVKNKVRETLSDLG